MAIDYTSALNEKVNDFCYKILSQVKGNCIKLREEKEKAQKEFTSAFGLN